MSTLLRDRSREMMTEDPQFWSKAGEEARPVDSVPDAAELVVSGEAEAFHVLLGGIRSGDVVLPEVVEGFRGAFERFLRDQPPGGVAGQLRAGVESDEVVGLFACGDNGCDGD